MTKSLVFLTSVLLVGTSVAPHRVAAQEKAALVPLKLQLVVSRTSGEKKISSLPYTLWVTANDTRGSTNLRMGVSVPVMSSRTPSKEGEAQIAPSYNYQQVGTNIDCSATTVAEGAFQLRVSLEDTSIYYESKDGAARPMTTGISGVPAFRTFRSAFSFLLKDGQTAQYTSATDPVSGEVLRVDVTLNVLK